MKLQKNKLYFLEVDRLGDGSIIDKTYGVFVEEDSRDYKFNSHNNTVYGYDYSPEKDSIKKATEINPSLAAHMFNEIKGFTEFLQDDLSNVKKLLNRKKKSIYDDE